MHENNFEKQVREKMDQLGFDPSDAVWSGVNREINKDRKRRVPIFWLILPFGLLLAGAGFYMIGTKNASYPVATAQKQVAVDKTGNKQKVARMDKNVSKEENKREAEKKSAHRMIGVDQIKKKFVVFRSGRVANDKGKIPLQDPGAGQHESGMAEYNRQNDIGAEHPKARDSMHDAAAETKMNAIAANKPSGPDSVSDLKTAKKPAQTKKASKWKIGITGNAGISSVDQSLFKSVNTSSIFANASSYSAPGARGANAPSEINPGFSFGIGLFVNRQLSDRISFSAGLGYHYYSTEIHTGQGVDSASFVYSPSFLSTSVNAFYRYGNQQVYTNQYHFIELPLNLDFQLNKSRKLPVIWEGGLSLSYLVSSNALSFDPITNVYYKNSQAFNKTQFSGFTAILIGLAVRHAQLQIGPQVQYGLTGLLNSGAGNTEHLFYYGLKVSFLPGKK